jgi:uncharacterized protein (TIGR03118 family)
LYFRRSKLQFGNKELGLSPTGYEFIDKDNSDPIPSDYAPSNILHLDGYLFVLWCKKDPNNQTQFLDGPGYGFISIFNLDGSFVRRFVSRGALNSPWAMIPTPCECGFPPGSYLIGNNGDGRINIYDCNARYVGVLLYATGLPIVIYGLWGLAIHHGSRVEIYFVLTDCIDNDRNIIGSLEIAQKICI